MTIRITAQYATKQATLEYANARGLAEVDIAQLMLHRRSDFSHRGLFESVSETVLAKHLTRSTLHVSQNRHESRVVPGSGASGARFTASFASVDAELVRRGKN
jgi:hypothetical protein